MSEVRMMFTLATKRKEYMMPLLSNMSMSKFSGSLATMTSLPKPNSWPLVLLEDVEMPIPKPPDAKAT